MADLHEAPDTEILREFQRRFVATPEAAAILGLVGRAGVGYHTGRNLQKIVTLGSTNFYQRSAVEALATTLTHKRNKETKP